VKQLTRKLHCDVVFSKELCTLEGPSLKRPVVVGKEAFRLYLLDRNLVKEVKFLFTSTTSSADSCHKLSETSEILSVSCNQVSKASTFDILHSRVGDIPIQRMRLLPIDIVFLKSSEHVFWQISPKAKQQRLPFQLSTIYTCAPFELIYVDTWGLYHTKTYLGHRFFSYYCG